MGAWLFVQAGTNWTKGFYQIASVSAGAATLTAGIGTAQLFGGATILNTVAGCATTASPSSGTWGIDYSQQDAAQISFTDMVIGVTTTKFTSVANPVGVNMIGNLINVASGTGFSVQFVEIVSTSTITATCDKSLGTTASTGGTGKLGGALLTLATTLAKFVSSNRIFLKAGTYQTAATITVSTATTPTNAVPYNRLIGYYQTRGDIRQTSRTAWSNNANRPVVQLITNTGLTGLSITGTGWIVENIIVDCNSKGTSTGIGWATGFNVVRNCKVLNFTAFGINDAGTQASLVDCEVTAGSAAATAAIQLSTASYASRCNVHDNTCPAFVIGVVTYITITDCLITNNAGASSDGINFAGFGHVFLNNIVYKNGRHGIGNVGGSNPISYLVRNNIITENGTSGTGYGLQIDAAAGMCADPMFDGNAFYANATGPRNNMDDLTTNKIDGVAPYVNVLDVTLTGDPFTNAAGGDFSLNNTAGAGAACRAAGTPGAMPGISQVGYPDMGALQHLESSGGVVVPTAVIGTEGVQVGA